MTRITLAVFLCWVAWSSLSAQQGSNQPPISKPRDVPPPGKIEPGARMVELEVVIVETVAAKQTEQEQPLDLSASAEALSARIRDLEKQGKLDRVSRVRLTTLAKRAAFVHVGERVPVISSRTSIPGGAADKGAAVSVTHENVGTIVGLTPDVSDDGAIVLELDVEKSHVHDCPTRGDADQGRVFPPRTVTATCQTTVRVPRGKTVIVGGMQTHSEGESSSLLILVTAELPGK